MKIVASIYLHINEYPEGIGFIIQFSFISFTKGILSIFMGNIYRTVPMQHKIGYNRITFNRVLENSLEVKFLAIQIYFAI